MAFTGAMMGLPERDWPYLTRLTTQAIAPDDVSFRAGSGDHGLAIAHHELFDYFADQAMIRTPRDDLIGYIATMPVGVRKMRIDEIIYNCYSLLLGANVTTPHAIAATVLAFIEYPDQYARINSGDDIVKVVEEGLRWSSPANHFMRYAVLDTELSGIPVKSGDALVAWLGSANRDERVFPDPYKFDVARSPNRHLAFGLGPHYCVGASLARVALRLFFEEFVKLADGFELAGHVEHLRSNFTAGIKRMPITVRLRDTAAGTLRDAVAS